MTKRPLITTDCHVAPPPTLADQLPERMRSQVTHLENRSDGVYLVRPEQIPEGMRETLEAGGATGMTALMEQGIKVDPDDERALARVLAGDCCAEALVGFTAQRYIDELDRDGVVGAVLIGGAAFSTHSDNDVDIAWTRLVNDWIHDEFKDHLDRFAPGISLPLGDVDASIKELERAAGLGLRPVLLPDVLPSRPYTDPAWEPLWEAAEGLGVPLATHVGPARALYPWAMQTALHPWSGRNHRLRPHLGRDGRDHLLVCVQRNPRAPSEAQDRHDRMLGGVARLADALP